MSIEVRRLHSFQVNQTDTWRRLLDVYVWINQLVKCWEEPSLSKLEGGLTCNFPRIPKASIWCLRGRIFLLKRTTCSVVDAILNNKYIIHPNISYLTRFQISEPVAEAISAPVDKGLDAASWQPLRLASGVPIFIRWLPLLTEIEGAWSDLLSHS